MRRGPAVVATCLAMVVAAGCGGSSMGSKVDPQALLVEAKATIDASHSAHFVLTSHGFSGGAISITGGDGDLVRPDEIQGSFTVALRGFRVDIKVVSKGGVFEVLLPFQASYRRTNPANYGLDDPAQLLDPVHGLSNLLVLATGAHLTGQERIAGELLDEVTAAVPGSSIPVLPDVNPSQPVTLVAAIDPKSRQVRQITLTGPFLSATSDSTFVVTLTKYDEAVTVTLPPT
jgi:lipoprotein LprG